MTKSPSPSPKALRKAFRAEKACPLFVFELGVKVKDIVSGFQGIVTSRTEYLNGCIRYGVEAQELKKDGDAHELWFDEAVLERKSAGITRRMKNRADIEPPGGPRTAPPSPFSAPK